ncbi:MAG: dihydrolipoamide acetyltransferase family protein [Anaerolineae bacterium]
MYEFKLPDVGEGIHEAEIVRWLVKEGDAVGQDQIILEIQTDKAIVEMPSPVAGTIVEIKAQPGAMVQLGEVLVVIAPAGEVVAPTDGKDKSKVQSPKSKIQTPGIAGPGERILAAPAVRKLALELGVDLARVPGSGPAGRVLPGDVRRFAEQAPAPPEAAPPGPPPAFPPPRPGQEVVEEKPLQGLRRRIAERMDIAWRVPHVTSFDEVDASHLVALRQSLKPEADRRGVQLTYLPLIIKATVRVLQEFPDFNASLDMENRKILLRRYYHIGVATAIPEGLVVPVIRHADRLTVLEIAAELARLADLARQRKLSLPELSGSTFTVTNFGSFGGGQGTPIINPPEVAILGTGRIADRPLAVGGRVEVRPVLPLVLSYDHRLIDGAAAGRFLGRLKALLADPRLLLLELR